jgi:hypothetical protein
MNHDEGLVQFVVDLKNKAVEEATKNLREALESVLHCMEHGDGRCATCQKVIKKALGK